MAKQKTDPALLELQKLIPPLQPVEGGEVNWQQLEESTGLQFPASFKDFISVYGSSIWFDTYSLFFTRAQSSEEIEEYQTTLQEKLDDIRFDMYDEETRDDLEYGIDPSGPGLLPFMIDYNGCTYLWLTSEADPEQWPVLYWQMGATRNLGPLSLAQMFVDWLSRKEPMLSAWGDSDQWKDTTASGFIEPPLSRR